ncbi:exported hypothetical protein [Gammaproteobacteria bacterium]
MVNLKTLLVVLSTLLLFCNPGVGFAKDIGKGSPTKKIIKKIYIRAKGEKGGDHLVEGSVTSCHTTQILSDISSTKGKLIYVPLIRQFSDYDCGVVAAQSILAYYGLEVSEDKLMEILGTTQEDGTNRKEIIKYAEEQKFVVEERFDVTIDQLKQLLNNNLPIMIPIQAWPHGNCIDLPFDEWKNEWNYGHWVVATGYDDKNIYFMDPSTLGNYTLIPIKEFEARWHDQDSYGRLNHYVLIIAKPSIKKPIPKYTHYQIDRLG